MTERFNRALELGDFTGRTLEGVAYRYDRPSRVTDDFWRTSYFEEFTKGCDVRTLKDRAEFPVHRMHEGGELGAVSFAHSDDEGALLFTAKLARNAAADEVLENIEQWKDVSVSFDALRSAVRHTEYHGPIRQRCEIRIAELSLAATGTGLAKGAEVTHVRASGLAVPRLESVQRRKLFTF